MPRSSRGSKTLLRRANCAPVYGNFVDMSPAHLDFLSAFNRKCEEENVFMGMENNFRRRRTRPSEETEPDELTEAEPGLNKSESQQY